jgi:uncharacterized membrane protein HdeD (DUF308 family)
MSAANDPSSVSGPGAPLSLPHARISVHREFHHLRLHWWWFLLLGVLLVICGTVAVISPVFSTILAIDVLSVLFLIAGVATVISSFWAGQWSGFLVHLLIGILYVAAGFVISEHKLMSVLMVTIFIAVSFIVAGIFRALAALLIRFPQWG